MNHFEEAAKKRSLRYDEIKHLAQHIDFVFTPGYAHFTYRAETKHPEARALSASDVALLADGGNLCFGCRNTSKSHMDAERTVFSGTVHTD